VSDVSFLSPRHTLTEQAINGQGSGTADQDSHSQAEREQMVLKSLAFLLTKPVHVKAKMSVHHGNGSHHQQCDGAARHSGKGSANQCKRAEKLGENDKSASGVGIPDVEKALSVPENP